MTTHAPLIDAATDFGARVAARLQRDNVIWLTTTAADGTPQPNPVWFLWNGTEFLIFSKPGQAKVRNLTRQPRVSLNLNSTFDGGDFAIFVGDAHIAAQPATPGEIADYTEKYTGGLASLNFTAEQFFGEYNTLIRITPDKLRGY
ncbi:TIGR03667 family PPOX class F420-dependent oxidoreductase [Nocardia sp. NPDC005978]|uniref:TIGR03667 family PPOX class F420-dependent oxidoreductase n=1 Tax=unclassified Nocardia TaxID=2637762 RepID=UPI0033B5DADF